MYLSFIHTCESSFSVNTNKNPSSLQEVLQECRKTFPACVIEMRQVCGFFEETWISAHGVNNGDFDMEANICTTASLFNISVISEQISFVLDVVQFSGAHFACCWLVLHQVQEKTSNSITVVYVPCLEKFQSCWMSGFEFFRRQTQHNHPRTS